MNTLTSEAEVRVTEREGQKARYEQFRLAAQARHRNPHGKVTVPDTAEVMLCTGGAYVEAMVWVGEDEL